MQIMVYIFWILIGALLAIVFIKSQQWSVSIINPNYSKLSKWLIVGGAFIRWLTITITFFYALRFSITAMLLTFFAFIVVRVLMLFRWHHLVDTNKKQVI